MPIKVACQCGQQFVAKDELAGKRVKCPKCGTALTIPQPGAGQGGAKQQLSDLLDDAGLRAGLRRCPGCGFTLDDLRRIRRFGCAECYTTFRDEVSQMLRGTTKCSRYSGPPAWVPVPEWPKGLPG